MKKIIIVLFLFVTGWAAHSQQFISSGMIEFEVRTNNHKTFGDGIWAEMFKDKIPQFSTSWYQFTFHDNKAVYKFDRRDDKTKLPWNNAYADDNLWFNDYNNGTFTDQKLVFDDTYLLSDSLMNFNWKLSPNETREIAGFTCRKATGIIFDSVYVFAFYTDEITVSGGPMGISGLPGMILGITIPRMFTSWIATKVQVNGVNTNIIAAPQKGKKKKAAELQETVKKVTKDWGKWGQQSVWNLFL
ncbi:MAG TPA: GLPGLI family protein [Chitinophagaceae bacterium]|nr:GLPGLI family protein [Chitinophagaceae bacterium]